MKYTKNYKFKKPEPNDTRNINDINDSFDLVDTRLKETQDKNTDLQNTFKTLVETGLLEGGIEETLNQMETQYTPQLNEVKTQLQQTAMKSSVDFNSTKGRGLSIKRPMLTFVTDDAAIEDYTLFKDIFSAYGIGCSTAVPTNRVGTSGHCTKEQLLELQDMYGWEMVSHTTDHDNLPSLTDSKLDKTLKDSRQWLIDNGFKGYDHIMYPYGLFDDRVKRVTSKYYKLARTTKGGYNDIPIPSYELLTWFISQDKTVDDFKILIDTAISNKEWIIIFSHSWEIAQWGMGDVLKGILEYATTKQSEGHLDIVNFQEAYELIGNTIEQALYADYTNADMYKDHFVVSGNGIVSSNIAKTRLAPHNSIGNSVLPSELPEGYLTICNIQSSSAAGFPDNAGGLLFSYKFAPGKLNYPANYPYIYQEYVKIGTTDKYVRRANSWTSWTAWAPMNKYTISMSNVFTGNSIPSDFPASATTSSAITSATAALGGLPTTNGGVLTTSRPVSDYGYCHQEFKTYSTNDIYIRRALSLTTWSTWERLSVPSVATSTRNNGTFYKNLGCMVFDVTLGKPIWYNGINWVDSTGIVV